MNDWQILKNKLRYINANDITRMAETNKRNRSTNEPIEEVVFELGRVGITTFKLVGVVDDPLANTDVTNAATTNKNVLNRELETTHIEELADNIEKMEVPPLPTIPPEAFDFNNYMTEKEASLEFGKTRKWFSSRRYKKTGPPFIKIANKVLYPINEIREHFGVFND